MKSKAKKRQDDFQKVKLKVGKKKPKAANATNVNFRTKGIHLTEQLKRDGSGPTTHKKLSLDNLLTQLHHYSGPMKETALVGLRELLALHPSVLEQHLSRLLSEVAAVFTDRESTVRLAATRLLRFIAQSEPADRVAPFFPLLSAHLSCAMTHIDTPIQEDALKVLDVFLEHYPALLASCPAPLLRNFLEMVSHRRSSGVGGKRTPEGKWAGRSLSVDPSRTVTGQQWRLTVLLRLSRFLQAVVEERPAEDGKASVPADSEFSDEEKGQIEAQDLSWEELAYGRVRVRMYENSGAKPTPHSSFKLRPDVEPRAGVGEGLGLASSVQGFAATLVPVLLEVWVEACASEQTRSDGAPLLSPDAMTLMYQVLLILQLLRRLAPQRDQQGELDAWFRSEYLTDFKQHFLKNFPYGALDTPKHRKKGEAKRTKLPAAAPGTTVEPLALNVTLCQVMVSLSQRAGPGGQREGPGSQREGPGKDPDADWLMPLRTFVKETLTSGVKLSHRHLHTLLMTVWRLVVTQRSRAMTEDLLQAVYFQWQQKFVVIQSRSLLFSFFSCLYLQEHNHAHLARSRVLSQWLAGLPVQLYLLGPRNPALSSRLLHSIHAAASRRNKDLLNSLKIHACKLYDPQEGSVVLLPAESQQRLVQLLYFLPVISQSLLANLSRCCTAGRISAGLAASLIRILHLRSSLSGWSVGRQEVVLRDVDYLSFLFSTLTGFSSDELTTLQEAGDDSVLPPSPLSPLSLYPTPLEQFTHHWDVVEEVCYCLETMGSRAQCFDVLQSGISSYLGGSQQTRLVVVPDSMAAGLLRAVSRLLDQSCFPSESLLRFLAQCCLSLLALLTSLQQDPGSPNSSKHKSEAVWDACVSALSSVPRLLRMVLQSLHVGELCEEELPLLAQMLCLLLQHAALRNHLVANAPQLQIILQELTRYCHGKAREQWLNDLQYWYDNTMTSHRANLGLRHIY